MLQELTQTIEQLIMPCIAGQGAELVELKVRRQGGVYLVEILADKETGGITMGECAVINREISQKCEQSKILGQDFEITVASPGLDRPLKNMKDFLRNKGRVIHVYLRAPWQERWECHGVLKEVKENELVIEMSEGIIELSMNQIQKAIQTVNTV